MTRAAETGYDSLAVFHPPSDAPFIDSAGRTLTAAIHTSDRDALATGIVGSLSPGSMLLQVDFLDGSFSGFVYYSADGYDGWRDEDSPMWRPVLTWSDDRKRWEPATFGESHYIVIEESEREEGEDE